MRDQVPRGALACPQRTLALIGATLNQLSPKRYTKLPQQYTRRCSRRPERKDSRCDRFAKIEKHRSEQRTRPSLQKNSGIRPFHFLDVDMCWTWLIFFYFPPLRDLFPHRKPEGVMLRAGSGAQRVAGGNRTQAGLRRQLPLRQWLHAGGRTNPHLHHGSRWQAELEQSQTHLHW